jgi:glutaredoxin
MGGLSLKLQRQMRGSLHCASLRSSWCRDCREAKRFLAKHNIPFNEIDIEEVPGAADAVVANVGKRAIPQFVIDGKWVQPYKPGQGFLHEEMAELFGVAE